MRNIPDLTFPPVSWLRPARLSSHCGWSLSIWRWRYQWYNLCQGQHQPYMSYLCYCQCQSYFISIWRWRYQNDTCVKVNTSHTCLKMNAPLTSKDTCSNANQTLYPSQDEELPMHSFSHLPFPFICQTHTFLLITLPRILRCQCQMLHFIHLLQSCQRFPRSLLSELISCPTQPSQTIFLDEIPFHFPMFHFVPWVLGIVEWVDLLSSFGLLDFHAEAKIIIKCCGFGSLQMKVNVLLKGFGSLQMKAHFLLFF